MISDGHVDIYDSKNITLSWNRFEGDNIYSCGGHDQYVNLVMNSEATYHHNYFHRTNGRNPDAKGQGTKVHFFNNLWKDITRYSIGAANFGQVKVEGNYFENSVKPHWNVSNGLIDANIQSNVYTGLSGTDSFKDTGSPMSWTIPYAYNLGDVAQARNDIISGAGPQ
jgi:pectate lyase